MCVCEASPSQWVESGGPQQKWEGVEVPDIELVVQRASHNHPDQVRGEQSPHYVCN